MPEGAGYNIPISLSAASTFSVPQTQNLPSYVVFGTGNKVGGDIQQSPSNINPATAVSSASQRDASASSGSSGVAGLIPSTGTSGLSTGNLLLIGGAVLAVAVIIGAAIYFKK